MSANLEIEEYRFYQLLDDGAKKYIEHLVGTDERALGILAFVFATGRKDGHNLALREKAIDLDSKGGWQNAN